MADSAMTTQTVLSLLTTASDHLREKRFDEARLHVELMLANVLGLKRLDLYLQFDRPLTEDELARFRVMYRRRLDHEPLQYILGTTEFMGLPFIVDQRVLVPRAETEVLVEKALAIIAGMQHDVVHVLDIGTGSGNIAVSIAHHAQRARVLATDLSAEALEVARLNADHLVPGKVEFLESDMVSAVPPDRRFELIVSNPPYVRVADLVELQEEVHKFEPRVALTDGGDGMKYIRLLTQVAPSFLTSDGCLLLEVGYGQAEEATACATTGGLTDVVVYPDFPGIPRVLVGKRKPDPTHS
jgi:release factor glutamine methyltransferase